MDKKHDCSEHGGAGVGSVFQTLKEMEFNRGPWEAAYDGEYDRVKSYLDKGGEPNVRDSAGYTPLHYSARNGYSDISQELIMNGALVNAQTRASKSTPLHRAARNDRPETVKLLLRHKADPRMQDVDGKTALHKGVEGNSAESCRLILEHTPECAEIRDNNFRTPKSYVGPSLAESEVCKVVKWRRKAT